MVAFVKCRLGHCQMFPVRFGTIASDPSRWTMAKSASVGAFAYTWAHKVCGLFGRRRGSWPFVARSIGRSMHDGTEDEVEQSFDRVAANDTAGGDSIDLTIYRCIHRESDQRHPACAGQARDRRSCRNVRSCNARIDRPRRGLRDKVGTIGGLWHSRHAGAG